MARVAAPHVREVAFVVGRADDGARGAGGRGEPVANREPHHFAPVVTPVSGWPMVRSNNAKTREYSSVHDDGRTNP